MQRERGKQNNPFFFYFPGIQKNQKIDLMQNIERYPKILSLFGINGGQYEINYLKLYLIH